MKILNVFKSLKSFFNRDNLDNIAESLAITNFSINKGSYFLYWGIALFTIIFAIWASLSSVDQVVRATGTVVPTSKVHTIQSASNGIIEEINVKMSDTVEKGEILFLINYSIAKERYKLAKSTRDALERKVNLIEELVNRGSEAEIRLIDEKLRFFEADKSYLQSKLELDLSQVIAPVSGVVSSVNATNVDQVVQASQEIATIVPSGDKLQIEANVLPQDIAYVIPGLKARLAFSAYDMAIYGQFEGEVTKVAPNTSQSSEDQPVFYKTIIEIDKDALDKSGRISLQSGMVVDVSIIGEPRTVASYIINPITKLSKTALRD
jgi:multidrug efflux pump subunit AcrA (membrane-fusion protein)